MVYNSDKLPAMNHMALRIAATLSFAGTVTVNALANILPINGLTTGQVSALYPSLFTPAGLTFSIWSVIYFLLSGLVIMSWLRPAEKIIICILPWFILTCLLNISWIVAWHHLLALLSVCIMLALLATLIVVFRKLHQNESTDTKLKFWVVLPFTIYLAWICVATIANIAALLISLNWQGGSISPQLWTILMMTVAAALALRITLHYRVPFFSLVIIWALFGIYFRWHNSNYSAITVTAIVLITFLAVGIFYITRKRTST